jgi:hypothetical protein
MAGDGIRECGICRWITWEIYTFIIPGEIASQEMTIVVEKTRIEMGLVWDRK